MATKSTNGAARTVGQPGFKQQTETILAFIPSSLSVLQIPARDSMTDAQFDAMIDKGYRQAKAVRRFP